MKLLLLLSLFWACCAAIVKKKDTFLIRESVRHLSDHSHDWCESLNLLDGWCDEMPEADKIATTCWVGDLNPHEVLFFHKHDIIDEHLTELGDMQDCKEEGNCDYELLDAIPQKDECIAKMGPYVRQILMEGISRKQLVVHIANTSEPDVDNAATVDALAREVRADVIFLDPPFADIAAYQQVFSAVEPLLASDGILVAQHDARVKLPEQVGSLTRTRQQRLGDNALSFYRREQPR